MMTGLHFFSISFVACAAASCLVSGSARAAIYAPGDSIPNVQGDVFTWSRGDAGGSYTGWVGFEGADLSEFPADLTPNASGQYGAESSLQVNSRTSIVASTDALYSFAEPQDFTAIARSGTSGGDFTRIVAQFRTNGTELNYGSILLSSDVGTDGNVAPTFMMETGRDPGSQGSEIVETLALWDLDSSQDAFRLDFNALGPHLSFEQFHLDTFTQSSAFASVTAVPEPASWLAIGMFGAAGLGVHRARRRRLANAVAAA